MKHYIRPHLLTPLLPVLLVWLMLTGCGSHEAIPPVIDRAEEMYAEFEERVPSAKVRMAGKTVNDDNKKVRQLDVIFENGPTLERDMMLYCGLAYELALLARSHLQDPDQYDRIMVVLLNVEGVGHEFITRYEYEYTSDYLDSQKKGSVS